MNLNLILLTLAAVLTLVACPTTPPQTGSPAPPTPPTPQPGDTTAPTIVSVSPNNAANDVEANAKIRIEFSEPMNQRATEQAYQSIDMPSVTFTWSANDTKLEIDPAGDLEHTLAGRLYNFTIRDTARDLAGNKLARLTSRFRTLRELTQTLESVAALDGDILGDGTVDFFDNDFDVGDSKFSTNAQYKGFVSFSLTDLATDGLTTPERITAAELRIFQSGKADSPYADLQQGGRHLLAAHVAYGASLNFGDFNSAILHNLGEISSNDAIEYKVAPNALESVRDDWAERVGREDRSQFMFFFPLQTDADSTSDVASFDTREAGNTPPQLEVTFLVP